MVSKEQSSKRTREWRCQKNYLIYLWQRGSRSPNSRRMMRRQGISKLRISLLRSSPWSWEVWARKQLLFLEDSNSADKMPSKSKKRMKCPLITLMFQRSKRQRLPCKRRKEVWCKDIWINLKKMRAFGKSMPRTDTSNSGGQTWMIPLFSKVSSDC